MAKGRLERAISEGFYLEAIALEESMMADRLESLLGHGGEVVTFGTIGQLVSQVRKQWPESEFDDVHERLRDWSNLRAEAIHQMVKYGRGYEMTWRERISSTRKTAEEGRLLVLEVDRIVRRMKRRR
jgi:hypothetical protein